MIRSVDVELFGWSLVASGAVFAAGLALRRRVLTGPAVLLASLVAIGAARVATSSLPASLPPVTGAQWLGGALVAGVSSLGGRRLRGVAPSVQPLLGLALVALGAVWMGVPETSYAIVAGGVLLAMALAYVRRPAPLTVGAAAMVGALPALVGTLGSAGIRQAAIGSWLCAAPLMALALVIPPRRPSPHGIALSLISAAAAGSVAARNIAVGREWDASTWLATVVVLALAWLSALALRARPLGVHRP